MNTQTTVVSNYTTNPDKVSNSTSLEDRLTAFVKQSLADSYSQNLEDALQLLDCGMGSAEKALEIAR